MQQPDFTYDRKELIGKVTPVNGYIFGVLFLVGILFYLFGPSHVTLNDFKERWIAHSLIFLFLAYGVFYCLRMVLDKRIKLVINKNGVWYYEGGLIPWSNIYYYYFEIQSDEVSVSLFKLKLLDPEKELSIHVSNLDVGFSDIEMAIKSNTIGSSIIYLGIENK